MKDNKYTIVIPTRERCETLFHTLKTCVDQSYKNLEIIVSDNCSEDATEDVVRSFTDKRIRYLKTPYRMSMTENFEFALGHVTDGYMMFIGDDDGILPDAVEYVDSIVKKTGTKAVTSAISTYAWPNHLDESVRNSMTLSIEDRIECRDAATWIREMLTFEKGYTFDLPGAYCSFVDITIINKMKKNGVFFHSQTPDAYSAFACAFALDSYIYSHRAFSIHGASGRSNGSSYLSGKNKSEANLFSKENTIPFHSKLCVCPSYRIIAAEAFLQVKEHFPERTKGFELDLYLLLSRAQVEKNSYRAELIDRAVEKICELNSLDIKKIKILKKNMVLGLLERVTSLIRRFRNLGKFSSVQNSTILGVYNVYDASKAMQVLWAVNEGKLTSERQRLLKKILFLKA